MHNSLTLNQGAKKYAPELSLPTSSSEAPTHIHQNTGKKSFIKMTSTRQFQKEPNHHKINITPKQAMLIHAQPPISNKKQWGMCDCLNIFGNEEPINFGFSEKKKRKFSPCKSNQGIRTPINQLIELDKILEGAKPENEPSNFHKYE